MYTVTRVTQLLAENRDVIDFSQMPPADRQELLHLLDGYISADVLNDVRRLGEYKKEYEKRQLEVSTG